MLRTSVWILHQYQNVFQRTFSTNIGQTTCATRGNDPLRVKCVMLNSTLTDAETPRSLCMEMRTRDWSEGKAWATPAVLGVKGRS